MPTDEKSDKLLESFDTLCTLMRDITADFVARMTSFIGGETVRAYSDEKKRIVNEFDLDMEKKFCVFEEISEKYYIENFHSDLLATILNPHTKEIGNIEILKQFLHCIGAEAFDASKKEDIEIEREPGRIDIFIKNKNQAVIVENKINDAQDQPDQLARYVRKANERELDVVKVVYLVKACKSYAAEYGRVASIVRNYDDEYKAEKKFLLSDKRLVILAAVTPKDEPKNLVNFLDECTRMLPQDERGNTARFCLGQYKILLQHIGGNVYMGTPEKELIKAIYSDEEKFRMANDFAEVWEKKKRKAIITEVIEEKFHAKFPDKEFKKSNEKVHDWSPACVWSSNFKGVRIYLGRGEDDELRQIGFTSLEEKKFSKPRQDKLENIVKKIKNKDGEVWAEDEWVYCNIKDSPTLFDDLLNALEILFKAK